MGYQPRIRSPKRASGDFKKSLRERRRDKKHLQKHGDRSIIEEKHVITEQELSEVTLKRLHTLGNQRFGSSPFSEHFDRWLSTVAAVLYEFESYPNLSLDDQYVMERSDALSSIKQQLEEKRRKEACIDQETKNLSDAKNRLKQINTEYSSKIKAIKIRKNSEIKRLNSIINHLEREQDSIIQLKTGFFRGISRKEKERREIEVSQQLNDKQRELELVILNFIAEQRLLREEYERKREPELAHIKFFQKKVADLETDGSLEERWFACEALVDAVNTFLQRKAVKSRNSLKADPTGN